MTIGHYMTGIWDHGGIAVYLRRVAAAQRAAGHAVAFFDDTGRYADFPDPDHRPTTVAPADLAERARASGVDVLHLHTNVVPWPGGGPPAIRTVHEHRPYCPSGERYLKRRGAPCDRVYDPLGCAWGHLVEHCGTLWPRLMAANFAATRRERATLDGAPTVAISHYVEEQMLRAGYDPATIRVIPNPAPPARPFAPPPREGAPRFLFLGRLSPHKGAQWVLRALRQVGRPVAIDIAGDGPQREELGAMVAEWGLGDLVTFHGWIDEPRIDELSARARAILFPSVWHEPAGLATLDGASRGRAVIASRSGGIPEYVTEGESALLVAPNDDAALAAAIRTLADDWDLARRLGEKGSELALGPFSVARHVEELDRAYREMAR